MVAPGRIMLPSMSILEWYVPSLTASAPSFASLSATGLCSLGICCQGIEIPDWCILLNNGWKRSKKRRLLSLLFPELYKMTGLLSPCMSGFRFLYFGSFFGLIISAAVLIAPMASASMESVAVGRGTTIVRISVSTMSFWATYITIPAPHALFPVGPLQLPSNLPIILFPSGMYGSRFSVIMAPNLGMA